MSPLYILISSFEIKMLSHFQGGTSDPMQAIPQLVVSTILLGGIYALIAVGLTLIFGVMRVVNFAHGEFLMLGMYLAFWAFALLRLDPYVTLVLALPLIFGGGWLSYC